MSNEIEVLFDNRSDEEILRETEEKIEKSIVKALEMQKFDEPAQVSVSFVTKDEIKELNAMYRNIDKVTDVLSFPMDDDMMPGQTMAILGDVVLCLDRAIEQAKGFGHSTDREICYLTVHSILHLLGYDHMEEDEKKEMRAAEEEIMTELKLIR